MWIMAWNDKNAHVFQSFSDMILDLFASCSVLVLNCGRIYPQYVLTSTIFMQKNNTIIFLLWSFLSTPLVIFWFCLQQYNQRQ